MKKLIILLLLTFPLIAQSQPVAYFDNNPQWRMHITFGGAYPCLEFWNYVYWVNGYDTIDGKVYAKLFETGTRKFEWNGSPPNPNCSGTYAYNSLRGLFRQEEKKIFIRENNADIMIYDFDLEVGDTLPDSPILYEDNIYVTAIDSILVGEAYRKVFSLSTDVWGDSDQMIEGIGFIYGFLTGFPDWFYPEQVVCFYLDGAIYYQNPNPWAPCDMFVGLDETTTDHSILEIFPNPTSGPITLKLDYFIAQSVSIAISDLTGRKLSTENWTLNSGLNVKSLDLSAYKPGMYFITLTGESGTSILRKKILVE